MFFNSSLLMPSHRTLFLIIFTFCFLSLATALFLQYHDHLEPCPLCIFQRVAYMSVAFFALIGFLTHKHTLLKRLSALLMSLGSLTGGGIALRHVWIQHLPADQVPDCGPGLNYLLDVFPLHKVVSLVLRGSGECAKIDWTLLGFSMPELSLAAFALITIVGLYLLVQPMPRRHSFRA